MVLWQHVSCIVCVVFWSEWTWLWIYGYMCIFLTFCWPSISVYLSQYLTNLMHKICFTISFYFMPLHVSSICAHHHEDKITLHRLWYHHTYSCDDTRGCVIQFWPPDDEHMCSKHVEAWNKLIVKQKVCALSWLITEINMCICWLLIK